MASTQDVAAFGEQCDVITESFKKAAEELEQSRAVEVQLIDQCDAMLESLEKAAEELE